MNKDLEKAPVFENFNKKGTLEYDSMFELEQIVKRFENLSTKTKNIINVIKVGVKEEDFTWEDISFTLVDYVEELEEQFEEILDKF